MNRIEIRRAAGSLIIGGFKGVTIPEELTGALNGGRLGGLVLFKRNIDGLKQVNRLNQALQRACPPEDPPPIVSVDSEGGKVARLRGLMTDLPPMADIGRLDDPKLCREIGAMMGRELHSLGFNTNFAPVLDVHTNPSNPVIGDRSFGNDPHRVSRLALAFASGLRSSGVIPCAKHFPGHGDTQVDSHIDLPIIEHDLDRLHEIELAPFRSAVEQKIPMIMTAHILVTVLDRVLPATLSPEVLGRLLRNRMGFGGVVISDDLEMGAVAQRYTITELVTLGLAAGIDLFLICHERAKQQEAFEALVHIGEDSSLGREQVASAAARVHSLRSGITTSSPNPRVRWSDVVRCPAHMALVEGICASPV